MPTARLATLLSAAFWMLAIIASFAIADRWRPVHGLRVTAYDTPSWSGRSIFTGVDASMSSQLLGSPPFNAWQVYSLEWTGFVAVREAGVYTFSLNSDDGSTLEVDGQLVVDNDGVHARHLASGTRELSEGLHPIRVRYFQLGGRYTLTVLWSRDGAAPEPIAPRLLNPTAMSDARARARDLEPVAVGVVALVGFAALFAGIRPRLARLADSQTWARVGRALATLERPSVAIAAVLAIGIPMRVAMLVSSPAILWPDSRVFHVTMREVFQGAWRSHDAYRTLVYPYFLGAILLWRQSPLAGAVVVAVQQLMGLVSAVVFYLVGRRAFSPLVAFAGALLFAVHSVQLFYEMSILTETLFTCTLALTLWAAVRMFDAPTLGRAATLGIAAVLLVLVRPVAQWFIVCVLGVAWFAMPPGRLRMRAAGVVVGCYAVPLVLWMSVNQHEYGFFGVSLGRGMGLYGRVFDMDRLEPPTPPRNQTMYDLWAMANTQRWSANRVRDELNYARGHTSATADEAMFLFARDAVLAHPVAFGMNTVWQWGLQMGEPKNGVRTCASAVGPYLCSGREEGVSLPAFPNAPAAPSRLRRWVVAYVTHGSVPMLAVTASALLGLAAYGRSRRRNLVGALLAVTVGYMTLVPALSQFPQDRFRLPVDALLFMFAAWGVRAIAVRWPAASAERPVAEA